ncbi:hypothetical protein M378DRAFT_69521 [Amanita muscaria Koide BX008]|uniref:RING-type E3 ubiquitin transferase n=1 Tax=Amanita muscaria (strain Koide BX008) TaxID=946122 RepID=A0A0C2XK30_AMAMK|nr:hypothetical protein M378DRAFT_69521 [Amanita muscaria Koide BX008]
MDNATPDVEAGQAPERQQRPRSSFSSLLFLCLMLFLLTSHNSDEFLARHHYQDALQILSYQLSNYTAWVNGTSTNFTMPDRKPIMSPLLEEFHLQGKTLDPAQESYFPNITGFIRGKLQYRNISLSALPSQKDLPGQSMLETYMTDFNATDMSERLGKWDWTTSEKIAFSVIEKPAATVQNNVTLSKKIALIHGRIEVTNKKDDLRFEFEGVHLQSTGSIFGFVSPNGQPIDIRTLPALAPPEVRNETLLIIEPELKARIQKLGRLIDAGVVDSDTSNNDETQKTACRFALYAQLKPVLVPAVLMQELEEETINPTGSATIKMPELSIDGILVSKECGILYEIHNTEGLRSQSFFRKVTTYAGTAMLAYLAMLILFARQTRRSRSPSGISRVSRWTFLTQASIDSVTFAGHITFAILAEGRPSLSLTAPAFVACILFIYEAQFAVLIYQIQLPETSSPAENPGRPSQAANIPTTQAPASLPLPVTQTTTPTASRSFIAFLIQHIRSDAQARLWIMLFISLTVVVRVIMSPLLSVIFVTIGYSSIWLPQIIRSARRARTSGLAKEYIFGTTVCRLYLLLYFMYCPRNVLDVEPRRWMPLLAIFVFLQGLVIILQEWLGPSFFLPNRYAAAQGYNYHPPIPMPDPESPEKSLGDCAICMDAILIDTPTSPRQSRSSDEKVSHQYHTTTITSGTAQGRGSNGSSTGAGALFSAMQRGVGSVSSRKVYSLAPCHHLFHTECLERWLAIKNICPQCRRPLPPM